MFCYLFVAGVFCGDGLECSLLCRLPYRGSIMIMNSDNNKVIIASAIISITVGVLSTGVILLQFGSVIGRMEANIDHLTRHTDHLTAEIISLHNKYLCG